MKSASRAKPSPARAAGAPKLPRGRPRSFDRERALYEAMLVFWKQGYEATSLQDLTRAMGINPPSLYAAFGDKEQLYLEAVERYRCGSEAAAGGILVEAKSARSAFEALLRAAARELVSPEHPRGCMVITGAINCGSDAARVVKTLAGLRARSEATLRQRLERAVSEGELSAETDVASLASFYMTVIEGMSLQARDGATAARLEAIASQAMRCWPST